MADMLASNSMLTVLGIALLHFWWQGALAAGVLWVVLGFQRSGSAQARYLASASTLAAMAALPLITLVMTYWQSSSDMALRLGRFDSSSEPRTSIDSTAETDATSLARETAVASPAAQARAARLNPAASGPGLWSRLRSNTYRVVIRLAPWWTCVWLTGVTVLSARLLLGAYGAARLRRQGTPPVELSWTKESRHLAKAMGIRRTVALLETARTQSLCVVGWLRPVILVPAGALDALLPEQVRLVLAHELAHVKRCDYLVNILQSVVEIILFFHPATWWVSGRIRTEREMCCDDLAVAVTGSPVDYARALAALAERSKLGPALAMSAQGGPLFARVQRLLSPSAPHTQTGQHGPQGLAALAGVAAAAILSGLALAEDMWPRTLVFPEDRSMGQLFIRDSSEVYTVSVVGPQEGEGWRSFGEAQGLVDVPVGADVMLRVSQDAAADLSPLETLDADALQKLDLSDVGLEDQQVTAILGLKGLRSLNLNQNGQLTDAALPNLAGMEHLVWLGVEKTAVTGDDADALTPLRRMQFFDAFSTNFSDAALEHLSGWTELRWLGLESTKVTDAGLRHLERLTNLEGLNLERTAVAGKGLIHLGRLENLKRLYLRATRVTDDSLAFLEGLPRLEYLNLKATQVSDAGLPSVARIRSIETLILDQTRVTDAGMLALAGLPNLRTADISETGVTSQGSATLKQLLARNRSVLVQPVVPAQVSTNPAAPKVGLVFSHFTAEGPHWIENNYGYEHQHCREIAGMLDEMNFDVYALIEPGTRDEGELPALLGSLGLSDKTIEIADGQPLNSLDAIVVKSCNNTTPETIAPLQRAIEHGTGLVTIGTFGVVNPGPTSDVERFLSIKGASYNIFFTRVTCSVAAKHPILGDLGPGDEFVLDSLDGMRSEGGIVNGGALLRGPESVDPKFIPMYWNTLGKGRCVHMQWFSLPVRDATFGKYGLYERAINWVTGNPPETKW